ncbi:MAG TPA: hypothetical protein VGS08_04995 [Candidatus Saccharimonadales bacterium]|nr:hypothetical protein [Candidatus Saccharimonadales bacterium]
MLNKSALIDLCTDNENVDNFEQANTLRESKKIQREAGLNLLASYMAGTVVSKRNLIVADFLLFAHKLEELDFIYSNSSGVLIIDPP